MSHDLRCGCAECAAYPDAPARPETSAPPALAWNQQHETRLAVLASRLNYRNYANLCADCPSDAACRPACENRLAICAALQHIEGLQKELSALKGQAR